MFMYIVLIAAAVILDVESNSNHYQDDKYKQNPLNVDYLNKWKLGVPSRDYSASPGGDDNYGEYPVYDDPAGKDGRNSWKDVDYSSRVPAGDASFTEKKLVWQRTRDNHVTRKGEVIHPFVNSTLKLVDNWPNPGKVLGQVSAVSIDTFGNVVVFHRGDRVWNAQSFPDNSNVYNERYRGPIKTNTIIGFNSVTGDVIVEWGSDIFYLPHGLTVDGENNVWVTDVALHQVIKFSHGGNTNEPSLILGVPFIPGGDTSHFCKPTSIAVLQNGDFFVADGYCNSRIMKYNKNAEFLLQWGRKTDYGQIVLPAPYAFSVPHSLALAKGESLLLVADRENGRIQCFHSENGSFAFQVRHPEFGTKLFAVAAQGDFLYAVNGPMVANPSPVRGFKIDFGTNALIEEFRPDGNDFTGPHDIAVSMDGKDVYVVEITPPKVWKFSQENQLNPLLKQSKPLLPSKVENVSHSPLPKPLYVGSQALNNKNITNIQTNRMFAELKQERYLSYSTEIILVVVSVLLVCFIAISAIAFVKLQSKGKGCSICPRYWRAYGNSSTDSGFKLGQLLDPHSGFEKVCTEESDEDDEDEEEELVESLGVNLNNVAHTVSHAQQA